MISGSSGKGVSPIIAAVMLLAFTITLAGLMGPWALEMINDLQEGSSEATTDAINTAQSQIKLRDIEYNEETNKITGYLQNTGSTKLTNFTLTTHGNNTTQKRLTQTLNPQQITSFTIENINTKPEKLEAHSEQTPTNDQKQITDTKQQQNNENEELTLSGSVSASPGLSDINVSIWNEDILVESELTDVDGDYSIDLEPGQYSISAAGIEVENIDVNDTTVLDFDLSSGEVLDGEQSTVKSFSVSSEDSCHIDGKEYESVTYPEIDSFYQVSTLEQLQCINNHTLEGDYRLTQNIDAGDTENWNDESGFVPIGFPDSDFEGVFDGADNTIKGLFINRTSSNDIGLLSTLESGEIKNIQVEDAFVRGDLYVGALIGNIGSGNIDNTKVSGSKIVAEHMSGIVIGGSGEGDITNVKIENSHAEAGSSVGGLYGTGSGTGDYQAENISSVNNTIEGGDFSSAGGVIGQHHNIHKLVNLSSKNNTVLGESSTGGIVGDAAGLVDYSYAVENTLEGEDSVGGLVGSSRRVNNSYARDNKIVGDNDVGGLVGETSQTISNSYSFNNDINGENNVGGIVGGLEDIQSTLSNSYGLQNTVETNSENLGGAIGVMRGDWSEEDLGTFNSSYMADTTLVSNGASNVGSAVGEVKEVTETYGTVENVFVQIGIHEDEIGTGEEYLAVSEVYELSEEEMQGEKSSLDTNFADLNFENTWEAVESDDGDASDDGYPVLQNLDRGIQLEAQGLLSE